MWFTFGAALVTSLLFGLIPALQATNDHLLQGLQESGRGSGGGRKTRRLRAGLVIAEMALAVVLLTGSGLLIRSFLALTEVDPGFQPGGAMTVRVTFQGAEYQNGDQVRARVDQLVERLRTLPGVTAIGVGSILPLGGLGALNDFAVDGAPPPPPNVNQEIAVASATPDYFKAIGAPLKRGRLFTDLDQPKSRAGGAAERSGGAALVPRTGSDRQARAVRRSARGGRHRRRRAAAHAGTARRPADVPALRAAHRPIGSHHRPRPGRSARAGAVGAGADPRARSEHAARRGHAARRRWSRDRWRGRDSTCRC